MKRKRTAEPVFDEKRNRWKLDVPAGLSDTGKRYRAWFKTRQAAREYVESAIQEGSASIPPSLAADADTARQRLGAAGLGNLTLAEVAAAYISAAAILGEAGNLEEAAHEFRRAHDARAASRELGLAVSEFLEIRGESVREATARSYSYTLERVLKPLHGSIISDITTEDLVPLFADKKATSRAMHLRNARAFWGWASKPPRSWGTMDALNGLEFKKESPEGEIVILKATEVRDLMKAAEGYGPNAVVAFALSIFAGVRQAELERLTWADLLEDHVEIGASIAKKGKRRLIPMSVTLRTWINAYRPEDIEKTDLLVGPNWREVSRAVRRRAGWDVVAKLVNNPSAPVHGAWPANAPRHTCASLLVATGEPLETLIFQFGHSGGHDLLRRHYVGRLTKKEALAILAVGPRGTKIKLIEAA